MIDKLKSLIDSFSSEIEYIDKRIKRNFRKLATGGMVTNDVNSYGGANSALIADPNSYYDESPSAVAGIASSSGYGTVIGAAAGTIESIGDAFTNYDQFGKDKNETAGAINAAIGHAFDPSKGYEDAITNGDAGDITLSFLNPVGYGIQGFNEDQKAAEERKAAYDKSIKDQKIAAKNADIQKNLKSGSSNRTTVQKSQFYYNRAAKGGHIASPTGISKLNGGDGSTDSIKLGKVAMVDDGEVKYNDYIFSNLIECCG